MRPFEKESQPVVTKGRRKSKLAAPKSKSAAALVKRKTRNARRKQSDALDDLSKEPPCHFVPIRRKPLGEYMKLEVPMASSSPSVPGMRMSYAAAVQTGTGVKVMISPRLNKTNKSGMGTGMGMGMGMGMSMGMSMGMGKGKAGKITADTKFRIFNEQPKPHIVRVDPKVYRADVDVVQKSRAKSSKAKKSQIAQKASKSQLKLASAREQHHQQQQQQSNDVDIKALQLQFNSLACNASGSATLAIKGNSLSTSLPNPNGNQQQQQQQEQQLQQQQQQQLKSRYQDQSPAFVDSVSYLSFHQARLQRIIQKQGICAICLQSPEPMKVPQFEDKHFKYLEEAALLAQNRTMLRLWMNSDQLIC
ncbi:hypothetical protein KR222_001036 [Zaprionus bogoriensis]|nr:hypothetical protein KR222_001036 [Zaprionus bogoriensis]